MTQGVRECRVSRWCAVRNGYLSTDVNMKEFRLKILEEGDELQSFAEERIVIKKWNGEYHIYRIRGFADGSPTLDRNFKLIIEKPEIAEKPDHQNQLPLHNEESQKIIRDEEDDDDDSWADENE